MLRQLAARLIPLAKASPSSTAAIAARRVAVLSPAVRIIQRWMAEKVAEQQAVKTETDNLSGLRRLSRCERWGLIFVKPVSPFERLFAVVHCGGKQYKVTNGDAVLIDSIQAKVGSAIRLNKVLAIGGLDYTIFGRPMITAAS